MESHRWKILNISAIEQSQDVLIVVGKDQNNVVKFLTQKPELYPINTLVKLNMEPTDEPIIKLVDKPKLKLVEPTGGK